MVGWSTARHCVCGCTRVGAHVPWGLRDSFGQHGPVMRPAHVTTCRSAAWIGNWQGRHKQLLAGASKLMLSRHNRVIKLQGALCSPATADITLNHSCMHNNARQTRRLQCTTAHAPQPATHTWMQGTMIAAQQIQKFTNTSTCCCTPGLQQHLHSDIWPYAKMGRICLSQPDTPQQMFTSPPRVPPPSCMRATLFTQCMRHVTWHKLKQKSKTDPTSSVSRPPSPLSVSPGAACCAQHSPQHQLELCPLLPPPLPLLQRVLLRLLQHLLPCLLPPSCHQHCLLQPGRCCLSGVPAGLHPGCHCHGGCPGLPGSAPGSSHSSTNHASATTTFRLYSQPGSSQGALHHMCSCCHSLLSPGRLGPAYTLLC